MCTPADDTPLMTYREFFIIWMPSVILLSYNLTLLIIDSIYKLFPYTFVSKHIVPFAEDALGKE